MNTQSDQKWLARAIEISKDSKEPIGCGVVIVKDNEIVAEEYNSQRTDNIAINHAEIKAIVSANKLTGSRKLINCTAYCSCEPCAMCLAALSYANIKRIVFNKSMKDLFPKDPQSDIDPYDFVKKLNFVPQLERLDAIEY